VISLALALLHARADGASRTHLAPWRLTTDGGLTSEQPAGIRAVHYTAGTAQHAARASTGLSHLSHV
jgi:hypothetical protein